MVLRISSWANLVDGAWHFYGTLEKKYGAGDIKEVTRILSRTAAEKINSSLRRHYPENYEVYSVFPGKPYNGFDSRDAVIKAAKEQWLGVFPDADVLIHNLDYLTGGKKNIDSR